MNLHIGDLVRNKERPELGTGLVQDVVSNVPYPWCIVQWSEGPHVHLIECLEPSDRVSLTSFGRAFHHIGCIAEDAAAE